MYPLITRPAHHVMPPQRGVPKQGFGFMDVFHEDREGDLRHTTQKGEIGHRFFGASEVSIKCVKLNGRRRTGR